METVTKMTNNVAKMLKNNLKMILAIAIVIVVARRLMKRCKESFNAHSDSDKIFVFFHMTGCFHCDNMMKDWDTVAEKYGDKMEKIERAEADSKKLLEKLQIQGFPTLMLCDKHYNKIKDYDGQSRSPVDLENFIRENI